MNRKKKLLDTSGQNEHGAPFEIRSGAWSRSRAAEQHGEEPGERSGICSGRLPEGADSLYAWPESLGVTVAQLEEEFGEGKICPSLLGVLPLWPSISRR